METRIDSIPDGRPMHVALTFVYGLSELNLAILEPSINPEWRASWGNYLVPHDILEGLGEWGIGSEPQYATERGIAIDYVKILSEVHENTVVIDDTPVTASVILSLVRRPDIDGGWYSHGIGDYWHPSEA